MSIVSVSVNAGSIISVSVIVSVTEISLAHTPLNSGTTTHALLRTAQVDFRPALLRFPLCSRSTHMLCLTVVGSVSEVEQEE